MGQLLLHTLQAVDSPPHTSSSLVSTAGYRGSLSHVTIVRARVRVPDTVTTNHRRLLMTVFIHRVTVCVTVA